MNLGLIISRLLLEYETVIVPGFGAFVSTSKSARIDEESNQIFPPSKEISFNQKIRNNDGLLVNFIAENERIPHFEASQKIEKERERILYQLDKGEKVILEKTGALFSDQSGTIQLEPFENENLLLDSFGLEPIDAKEVPRSDESDKTEAVVSETKDEKTEEQTESEFEPVVQLSDWKKKEPENENKSRGWLWVLFIVIPLMAVGIFMFLNQNKTPLNSIEKGTEETSFQNQIENNNIVGQDSMENDSTSLAEESIAVSQDSIPGIDNQDISEGKKYYLVGGSFKEEENAEEYFQELKKMGYAPFHLGKKGNFFLIGINTYNSEKEALKEQRLFLENNPGSGAWVYIE